MISPSTSSAICFTFLWVSDILRRKQSKTCGENKQHGSWIKMSLFEEGMQKRAFSAQAGETLSLPSGIHTVMETRSQNCARARQDGIYRCILLKILG